MKNFANKTYCLRPEDEEKLISMILRYRRVDTSIDDENDRLTVCTNFADNPEPTSIAGVYKLEVVSDEPPEMPEDERRLRLEGKA